ncbi:MAG TPA: sulfite exporter TauE/SafE family protein [Candidatus Saccharimonadales bacterium]|nr:sulfite exporter TauE/SafE family protein [Candidatus Saccharimonadales bacterium]
MTWHNLLPLAVFLVTFIASTFSGMAGGGGGFIMTPFYILIGLSPAQAVATGKLASFGLTGGAIAAFRKKMLDNKKFSLFIIALAIIAGLAASLLLQKIDNRSLQRLMGVFILAMVPFMLKKRRGVHSARATGRSRLTGTIFLALVLFLQGILSGGVGALVSAIFIIFFGATALEANMLKRKASLVLNIVIVVSLLNSGLINYTYGLFGMAGGLLGGWVGSDIAIKKGDKFAQHALIIFMTIAGVWLIAAA